MTDWSGISRGICIDCGGETCEWDGDAPRHAWCRWQAEGPTPQPPQKPFTGHFGKRAGDDE